MSLSTAPRVILLAGLTLTSLSAQDSAVRPRDLYLEKLPAAPAGTSAAHHLGLRYNVLLVDPQTRQTREADPDAVFHEGDCFAIEFTPNRGGNLYVFNHGSSGAWHLLMPAPGIQEDTGSVKAGELRRIPVDYCFRLDDKPGVETMLLAITEREEDVRDLRALVAKPGAQSGSAVAVASTGAGADPVADFVGSWQRMSGRDLKIEKIRQPEAPGERPNSVYVVKSSAAASDRLVVEVKIRHE